MNDIDGKPVKLETYRGKGAAIGQRRQQVRFHPTIRRTASALQQIQKPGLRSAGIPREQFFGPGAGKQRRDQAVLLPEVSGYLSDVREDLGQRPGSASLFTYLTSELTNPGFAGEISWNFNKFLADRTGKIVARFGSKTKPEDPEVIEAIEKALGDKQSE
jgi:glutathione peroxidase